jgi:hypothetical protein
MRPEALRLLVASFGFALYLGVPVHAVMLRPAEAAIASFSASGPGGIAREEGEDDTGDDSGDDGQGSSEDDSD